MFDRAGLDYPKTPKTQAPSFVANWLEAHEHKLPMAIAKARKLTKAQRAATAKKKKRSGGKTQFVPNTPAARVRNA